MTSLAFNFGGGDLLVWPDTAIGDDAARVREALKGSDAADPSVAFGSRKRDLDDACAEAAFPNWDGNGAHAIDLKTYELAEQFIAAVPRYFPDPDIAVDADGEVAFRWARAPREVLSVTLRGDGRLSYAALFGDSEGHGTERFFGEQLPEDLAANMARLFASWPSGGQGLRAAPPFHHGEELD